MATTAQEVLDVIAFRAWLVRHLDPQPFVDFTSAVVLLLEYSDVVVDVIEPGRSLVGVRRFLALDAPDFLLDAPALPFLLSSPRFGMTMCPTVKCGNVESFPRELRREQDVDLFRVTCRHDVLPLFRRDLPVLKIRLAC